MHGKPWVLDTVFKYIYKNIKKKKVGNKHIQTRTHTQKKNPQCYASKKRRLKLLFYNCCYQQKLKIPHPATFLRLPGEGKTVWYPRVTSQSTVHLHTQQKQSETGRKATSHGGAGGSGCPLPAPLQSASRFTALPIASVVTWLWGPIMLLGLWGGGCACGEGCEPGGPCEVRQ